MKESGYIANTTIVIAFLAVSTLAFVGLSAWSLISYRTNQKTINQQISSAVSEAKLEQRKDDEASFAEFLKQPYRSYQLPNAYGDITIYFPKNWNIYAEEGNHSIPLDAFIHPEKVVRGRDKTDVYALRVQLVNELYPKQIGGYQNSITKGSLKAKVIKISGVSGTRYDGKLKESGTEGSLVALPIGDKTLLIWTEDTAYSSDFNSILEKIQLAL